MGPSVGIAVSLLVVAQAGFGGVPEIDYAKIEKRAMRRRVAADRVKARFLRGEERSILNGIKAIDRQLTEQGDRLAALESREITINRKLRLADDALDANARELDALRATIGRRAAAMLRIRKMTLGRLLDRAQGNDNRRLLADRLRFVVRHDAQLVRQVRGNAEEAETIKATLTGERRALADTRDEILLELRRSEGLREERNALLGAVNKERRLIERLASEIAAAARRLDREKGQLRGVIPPPRPRSGNISRQRGRVPWPVVGRVEVPFGKRVDPASGVILTQRGIDIRAPYGEPVRAPSAGRVAYAGEVPGFGRVLILDHGGRWYTVYGHLRSFSVSPDSAVARGDVIGQVGATGSEKGPFLYFELRGAGRAYDPLNWLAP